MHLRRSTCTPPWAALLLPLLACNQLEALDSGGGGVGVPAEVATAFQNTCATSTACHATGGIAPTLEGGALDTLVGSKYVSIGDLAGSYIAVKIFPDATNAAIGATRTGSRMPLGGPYDSDDVHTIIAWIAGAEYMGGATGGVDETGGESTGGESTGEPMPLEPTWDNVVAEVLNSSKCSCHFNGAVSGMFAVTDATLYADIVDVPSTQMGKNYVTANDSANSYLYIKLSGGPGIVGSKMPLGPALTAEQIQLVADWIDAGAPM